MPSFLLALVFLFYFYKHSYVFVQASSISGDIVPYTAPLERREDLDGSTDSWLLQSSKGGDSPLLFSATVNQKNVAALTAPNTNSNNFPSRPNNMNNNNDELLLSEATTSETGLQLASGNNCRASSTNDDSTTLESSRQQQQMAAGKQSPPMEQRNIRGRRRSRRRRGENSVVVQVPSTRACPVPLPLTLPPPSTQQPQNAQNPPRPQKNKKKKTTTPTSPPDANTHPPQPSPPPLPASADLDWNEEMYPSLFRIPTDGYSEGGYNPSCIIKTHGLLPLGVCDSGDDEDVQGSARDFQGNLIDARVFIDAVAFKLERCRLGT